MRWPRLRFTVRRMMVAVAVLALILGGSLEAIRLKRFRDECLKRAAIHGDSEQFSRASEEISRSMAESAELFLALAQRESVILERADEQLRAKYLEPRTLTHESERKRGGFLEQLKTRIRESERKRGESLERQGRMAAENRAAAVRFAESAAYHSALKRKYLRAAGRPWKSVEPDPPPPDPELRGPYWLERGEYRLALAAYEEALRDAPDNGWILNGLAWLLATCPEAEVRDGKRAVGLATRACEVTGEQIPSYLDTLAAAHAEAGVFPTAVEIERRAIGKLPPGEPDTAAFRGRLDGYRVNQPYRDTINKIE